MEGHGQDFFFFPLGSAYRDLSQKSSSCRFGAFSGCCALGRPCGKKQKKQKNTNSQRKGKRPKGQRPSPPFPGLNFLFSDLRWPRLEKKTKQNSQKKANDQKAHRAPGFFFCFLFSTSVQAIKIHGAEYGCCHKKVCASPSRQPLGELLSFGLHGLSTPSNVYDHKRPPSQLLATSLAL